MLGPAEVFGLSTNLVLRPHFRTQSKAFFGRNRNLDTGGEPISLYSARMKIAENDNLSEPDVLRGLQ